MIARDFDGDDIMDFLYVGAYDEKYLSVMPEVIIRSQWQCQSAVSMVVTVVKQ